MNTDTPRGDDPDPARAALAALAAAHRFLSAVIDRELRAACGLSLAEADVLASLARGPDGRQRMADIADHVSVSKSGATQITGRLVAARLAARESSATDRRLVYAAITTAGRDVLDKAAPVLAAIAREHIASRLPATDLGRLTQALRTIAGTSPPEASQRLASPPEASPRLASPRAPGAARAPSASDRPAPAPGSPG
jgi:DNA-binding MarR family transcriptional regulator